MNVKCLGCYKMALVFSHTQTVVSCVGCSVVLFQPTGRKERFTEGRSFRRKQHQQHLEVETIPINTFWIKKKNQK
ncbi:40S ribosomal protein S27-like [Fukomys damarensis]|uniref:40S ribosomal protein S27-like n=1 Tax=Fukomys damarensis TaxID=885580 RepID=UPI001455215B|nr:40S ribosomal protein S27-like [Fukomys damarensis]